MRAISPAESERVVRLKAVALGAAFHFWSRLEFNLQVVAPSERNKLKLELSTSLPESHPPHQVIQARVAAKQVHVRTDVEFGHLIIAVLVRLFQPGERLVFLAQPRVQGSDTKRAHVILL